MTQIHSALDDRARAATGELLQDVLVDLVDLSLVGKQAHWTVTGPRFRALHQQLDEIVSSARGFADTVAERAAAIGVAPDARAATVAESSGLPRLGEGWQRDDKTVAFFVDAYAAVISRIRGHIPRAGELDPVTQDLLIQITAELEKQYWMFQAENTD